MTHIEVKRFSHFMSVGRELMDDAASIAEGMRRWEAMSDAERAAITEKRQEEERQHAANIEQLARNILNANGAQFRADVVELLTWFAGHPKFTDSAWALESLATWLEEQP